MSGDLLTTWYVFVALWDHRVGVAVIGLAVFAYVGLWRRYPVAAAAFTFFLLAFVSGLIGGGRRPARVDDDAICEAEQADEFDEAGSD